jgi:hypothetical protein
VRVLPWVTVLAAYVAAALTLDAFDPAAQTPALLERLLDDGGRELTAVVLAVPATLAFAFAAALARRWVPDPWATRAALLVALSPLGFALTSGARPDAVAAALLGGGLLLSLRAREHATRVRTLGGATCLSLAPFFGLAYAIPGLPVLAALVSWTSRRGRPLLALLAVEIAGATAVALLGIDQPDRRAATDGDGLERVGRVLVDVLRWAPVLVLAFVGAYLLLRSRRERVSRAIPARRDAEVAAALAGTALLALWGVAAFGSLGAGAGVPLAAAYAAWGMRRAPRIALLLGLAGLGLTIWMVVALAGGNAHGWLDSGAF